MHRLIAAIPCAWLILTPAQAQGAPESLSTTGACSPIVQDAAGEVEININCPIHLTPVQLRALIDAVRTPEGAPPSLVSEFRELSGQFGVTEAALKNFFKILEREQIPLEDLDATLREVAKRHLELIGEVEALRTEEPEVKALTQQALAAVEAAEFDRAETLLRQAEEVELAAARRAQEEADRRFLNAAEVRAQRGQVQLTQFHYPAAAAHFEAAAELVPRGHPLVHADYLKRAGLAWYRGGRYAEAEPLMKLVLAIVEAAQGPAHPEVASGLSNLAALYHAQGRYTEAEPLMKRALDIMETAFGPAHPTVGAPLNNLAQLYQAQGRYAEAEALMERALGIAEAVFGPAHPYLGIHLNNLALLYQAQGRYAEAELIMKRALGIAEAAHGPAHPTVGVRLSNLALLYQAQGRYAEAEPIMKRALGIMERSLGADHPDTELVRTNLARILKAVADGR